MLTIDILKLKTTTTINGEEIYDLIPSSIDKFGSLRYIDVISVQEDFDMRPDLVSQFYCQDQNSMGMILKLNGISNPFSLGDYDILFIPDLNSITSLAKSPASNDGEFKRDSFRKKLKERISKVSTGRQEYLNARNISDSIPLPPNVAEQGEGQFSVENGKLIFGGNIGVCRTKLAQNKSKATIKSRFAQGKIFDEL
jgi:hypothetical protein